jgi:histidine ammonia-lyase
MTPPDISIDGRTLTIAQLRAVAEQGARAGLAQPARARMAATRSVVEDVVARNQVVYGVTTGFGKLSDVAIPHDKLAALQLNLVRSHAAGVGTPLPRREVRAMMLLRANVLAKGFSGARAALPELLCGMLNADLWPSVPEQGSVGASGDLAPLAHLALALVGEGDLLCGPAADRGPAAALLKAAGLAPVTLGPKEGLSLINGTQAHTAIAALAVGDARTLWHTAHVAGAASLEALLGTPDAFDARIHDARGQIGQSESAALLRTLLADSAIRESHRTGDRRVQDAYALRCMPQVLSGGNFHGQAVAMVLDFLAIAMTNLATMSERRIDRLVHPDMNEGLPPFLARDAGVHSGFMMAQVTAASIASECKVLSHPSSVDTIPTDGGKEDVVPMAMGAAWKLRRIVRNVQHVLAIELMCAMQGLDYRRPLRSSAPVERAHGRVRALVETLTDDRVPSGDIAALADAIARGEFVEAVS